MQLPLRLQLTRSRSYLVFLAGGHILAGVAVCLLSVSIGVRIGLLLLLGLLLLRGWRAARSPWEALLLCRDGKMELITESGVSQRVEVGSETVVWSWLVVLQLRAETGRLGPLLLFRDGLMSRDAHRQLRLWLRWTRGDPG